MDDLEKKKHNAKIFRELAENRAHFDGIIKGTVWTVGLFTICNLIYFIFLKNMSMVKIGQIMNIFVIFVLITGSLIVYIKGKDSKE